MRKQRRWVVTFYDEDGKRHREIFDNEFQARHFAMPPPTPAEPPKEKWSGLRETPLAIWVRRVQQMREPNRLRDG
jgi:hypothetical protein